MGWRGDERSEVVGRDDELASIERFVGGQDFPRALVIEGEAGIGKTTLWRAGVVAAERAGYRVVVCRPAGAEVRLSFSALSDLLEGQLEEVVPELPGPQRRAIEVALLLEEDGGLPPDERAIAAAVLNGLRRLACDAPLLVAIDDAQWLDAPSAAAIEYAARRLRDEKVAVLASSRAELSTGSPLALDRAFAEGRFTRIEVGPLSLGALHRVLTERIAKSLNRPTLLSIHENSSGNPFYALELARTLAGRAQRTGERVQLSASLSELLGQRLSQFTDRTGDALAVAAAASEPTLDLVGAVLDAPADELLEPAVLDGVVRVAGGRIEFAHPLLASAAYANRGEPQRRHWHARLADISTELEERARHRALAAEGPDAGVATLLHEAGRQAGSRGAPAAAVELLEHAIALTPPDDVDARAERTVDAARVLMITGDRERARSLLAAALAAVDPGPQRADVLYSLAQFVEDDPDGLQRQLGLLEQSLEEAGADNRRRARALANVSLVEWSRNRLDQALEASRAALALAETAGDEYLLTHVLTRTVDFEAVLGQAEDPMAHFQRALELDEQARIEPMWGPATMLALCLVRAGGIDDAAPLLRDQHRRSLDEGNDDSRAWLSVFLAELEWMAGRWEQALAYAREGLELADQLGSRVLHGAVLSALALVEASRGEIDAARAHATDGINLCDSIGEHAYSLHNRQVLGFLELSVGDPALAKEHLSGYSVERGIEGGKRISFIGDRIESLVQLGELDAAASLVEELERRGDALHRPSLLAVAGRCRGQLAGARGDSDGAGETLRRATEEFEALNLPFERARTLLVLGVTERRVKRKRPARQALEAALGLFESLGAPLWAEKARGEMARIGGRRTAAGLTPTERRVAELVASGRSNKQVAAELFVSVRAVEANLTRVYAKLGIRSRTELAGHL
jgi:ATP/maltotriose-dependent transcriptional regulator MalT